MGRPKRAVRPLRDGRFAFEVAVELKIFVAQLAEELSGVLGQDAPMLRRLFPTAYPDDPERDAGYQVFARGELIEQRQAAIAEVRSTVDSDVLTLTQLTAWMKTVNDLRLVLGTQLDVSEDQPAELDDDDPSPDAMHIYHLLGVFLEEIIDALSKA